VFYIREADKYLAATSDCNAIYCSLDPREGARIAVAEAARNLACSGAVPIAVTDNLNFGNPYKPENFWQLRECVEGLAEACRFFNTPVTGGNVSLYNENPQGAIDPTPTVGMVGLIENEKHITTQSFKDAGDVILLIGELGSELGGSHYLKVVHGKKTGAVPKLDFALEKSVQDAVRALIHMGLVKSAHDCSEGGLAVAIAESCISGKKVIGAEIDFGATGLRIDQLLFNESQSRIVISVPKANATAALSLLEWRGVPARKLGVAGGSELKIRANGSELLWNAADLHRAWYSAISECMSAD
jgi:phosphoribosylformylglycinamidine synthase